MSRIEAAVAELRGLSSSWHLELDGEQTEALLGYAALLIEWNRRINLTGARSEVGVVSEHYPDAFALARRVAGPGRLIDIGSGGGLPAIPLAMLRPALTVELCEPIAKKAAFLRTAIRELGLGGRASVKVARAEELVPGDFDVAVSRATFEPEAWLSLGRQLVRPGGKVLILTVPGSPLATLGPVERYLGGRRLLVEVEAGPSPP